jgi:hypothetical protein
MGGKGELVRYSRRRAPKDPKEKGKQGNSLTYKQLKKQIGHLIDTASGSHAKVTIIALVEEPPKDE